jgi:chromosome segregation ATPase
VKELEHANRRFKVKIDMLEREKNTITKKFEVKIEELTNKNKAMEDQLADFESKAGTLETINRTTVMELESKLAQESSRVRELELSTNSAADKYNSKLKVIEMEMAELRETASKIDEYEQVLGKLMERNGELETEAKSAREERDMANRQVELSDRRRAVKVKDLEEQIAEQKVRADVKLPSETTGL